MSKSKPSDRKGVSAANQSFTLGEWLEACNINLFDHGTLWPLTKLNRLPNLRAQPKLDHNQCVNWHIFRDNGAAHLPPFEEFVSRLGFGSCRDAWILEKPIKLKEDRFTDFKAQLSEEKVSKMRILNVPVTENILEMVLQSQHSRMVRDSVQRFYDVAADDLIEVHDATVNITPPGTATEIHHDSDPHISTTCGRTGADHEQPMKLWLLWQASDNHRLPRCYSNTTKALGLMGPCGYLIQFSGESLMLPANVPHAALSLSSHYLYSQTFHVRSRARDPTTFELELSARVKPAEAVQTVLTCYEEGLQDADARVRTIHLNHALYTLMRDYTSVRRMYSQSYVQKILKVLRANREFDGVCGLCQHFGLISRRDEDCWKLHSVAIDMLLTAGRGQDVKRKRSA